MQRRLRLLSGPCQQYARVLVRYSSNSNGPASTTAQDLLSQVNSPAASSSSSRSTPGELSATRTGNNSSRSAKKEKPLPSPSDLLAIRPRLRRPRRRTDAEWAEEYNSRFQSGIASIERAFTLPQLEHLAAELELSPNENEGKHAPFRKRSLATALILSERGWAWSDPQILVDRVQKRQIAPPAVLDLDLSAAQLFLCWPTVHRMGATHNVQVRFRRSQGRAQPQLHLAGAQEDLDGISRIVQELIKNIHSFQLKVPSGLSIDDNVLKRVSLESLVYIEQDTATKTLHCQHVSSDTHKARAEHLFHLILNKTALLQKTPLFTSTSEANAHKFTLLPTSCTTSQQPWWIPMPQTGAALLYRLAKIQDSAAAQLPFLPAAEAQGSPELIPSSPFAESLLQALQPQPNKTFSATFGLLSTSSVLDVPPDTLHRTIDSILAKGPLSFIPITPPRFLRLSESSSNSSDRDFSLAGGGSIAHVRNRMKHYRTKSKHFRRIVYVPTDATHVTDRLVFERLDHSAECRVYIAQSMGASVAVPERSNDLLLESESRTEVDASSAPSLQPHQFLTRATNSTVPDPFVEVGGRTWALAHFYHVRETKVLDPIAHSGKAAPHEQDQEQPPMDWILVQSLDILGYATKGSGHRSLCLKLRAQQASEQAIQDALTIVHAMS